MESPLQPSRQTCNLPLFLIKVFSRNTYNLDLGTSKHKMHLLKSSETFENDKNISSIRTPIQYTDTWYVPSVPVLESITVLVDHTDLSAQTMCLTCNEIDSYFERERTTYLIIAYKYKSTHVHLLSVMKHFKQNLPAPT